MDAHRSVTDGFLLDTNVISELARPRPAPQVVSWFGLTPLRKVHLSVISLAESVRGVHRHRDAVRHQLLIDWMYTDMLPKLGDRLVTVTAAIADLQGQISADLELRGRQISFQDAGIAATALHLNYTLVTRNVRDFNLTGAVLLNPWESGETTE